MDIKILGWSYENIRRFGELTIDLTQNDGRLPHVALVMMRNGTGKTTTIQLIRAVLNGSAENWTAKKVRDYQPKDADASQGKFCLKIKYDSDVYYYILTLDYENGRASYQTSRVSGSSGGLEEGRKLPMALNGVFDVEEFVNRFVFDGEQARKTLNSTSEEAENAIKYLYQVDKLDALISKIKGLVQRRQNDARGASQQSVRNNRTRMEKKGQLCRDLELALEAVERELAGIDEESSQLQDRQNELLLSNARIRTQVEQLKEQYAQRHSDLIGYFATIKVRMREPYRVHPVFDDMLHNLADNMQTLRLPKTTAREFFRELAARSHCICGHEIGAKERECILSNAEEYLGEEDLVAINAIKDRIRNYRVSDELNEAINNMEDAKNDLEEISSSIDRLALQLDSEAQREINDINQRLRELEGKKTTLGQKRRLLSAPLGSLGIGATEQNNIALAKKAYEEAKQNYYTALGTYEYIQKADQLISYLEAIKAKTLVKLKATIIEKTNNKIEKIITDEKLVVEKIDGSLVLQGRPGASEGQTLAVAYAYICSLFEHSAYDFPFVVDSPAASMDLDVRREVATVIPDLFKQLIIFVTSGEVAGFAEKMYALDDIVYLTIEGGHNAEPAKCTIGKDFFSNYQSEEGEE